MGDPPRCCMRAKLGPAHLPRTRRAGPRGSQLATGILVPQGQGAADINPEACSPNTGLRGQPLGHPARVVGGVGRALTRPARGVGTAALVGAPQGGQPHQELSAWSQLGPGEGLRLGAQGLLALQSQGPQAVGPQEKAIPAPRRGAPDCPQGRGLGDQAQAQAGGWRRDCRMSKRRIRAPHPAPGRTLSAGLQHGLPRLNCPRASQESLLASSVPAPHLLLSLLPRPQLQG